MRRGDEVDREDEQREDEQGKEAEKKSMLKQIEWVWEYLSLSMLAWSAVCVSYPHRMIPPSNTKYELYKILNVHEIRVSFRRRILHHIRRLCVERRGIICRVSHVHPLRVVQGLTRSPVQH